MRGGYYGAAGAIAPGAMEWKAGSEYGDFVANRGGNMQYGRGRHRKSKGKKTRKMRGGSKFGATAYGFNGSGARGLAHAVPVSGTKYNPSASSKLGAFNDGGAHKGNFGSFKGLLPK
jgi:hypothetical protein